MPGVRWFYPEPEPDEGGLIGFRRGLLFFAATFSTFSSWLLFLWAGMARPLAGPELAAKWSALGLALLTLLLRQRWPRRASFLWTLGSLALNGLILSAYGLPAALPLFVLVVVLAGLLLGTPWEAAVAAVSIFLVVALRGSSMAGPPTYWLALLAGAAVLSILINRVTDLTDYWEREATQRQHDLILKLRDRQGELNRTLKALDEAYALLKRSHDELIVARRQAEEASALKEQFVANVSHELRTPLNLIVGFAEMMYLSPEIYGDVRWTPTLEGDIQEIYRASRHLQSLVNDILDLSRIDAARLPMFRELYDIRSIIAEAADTISPLLRQRGLEYHAEWPEELPRLFVDRTRVRQVLLNLFNNALRYTDYGGITVRIVQEEAAIVVSVQDTGLGIPEDQLENIFQEFRQLDGDQRRGGGAGLGLALSRQFIELHGGRMWATSKVGEGSTFHFSLPLPGAVAQTTRLQRTPDRRQIDLSHYPLVVIDPDPSIPEMLSRYLGDRRVLSARDALQAEALIEAEHPLAVIMNQLPDVPPAEWLGPLGEQSRRYGVPVLRCSIPSPSWLQQSSGLSECLTKPISREALSNLLQKHLRAPGTILVVDDDPGFVRLMVRMLETMEGVTEVLTAHSGARALRLAHEKRPALVLLDLLMPEMDGFAVLHALREDADLATTTVVAVTGTSYAEDALLRRGSIITLSQAGGISTGMTVEVLNAMLQVVRPSYADGAAGGSAPGE